MSRRTLTRARAFLRQVLALVATLAVISGSLLAGHTYFYCAPMQRVAFDDCCAPHEDEAAESATHAAAVDEPPHRCCRERTFAASDEGAGAMTAPFVAPPLLVEVLPAVRVVPALLPSPVRHGAGQRSRAGPPHASPSSSWRVPVDVSLS